MLLMGFGAESPYSNGPGTPGLGRMQLFYDADIDPKLIRARRVAVLGLGAQGKAQASNLKDSGVEVRVGLRAGSPSRAAAAAMGLEVLEPAEAGTWADVV